jgi:mannose-6-phosphate isomerase-like protein (cupin superfamily)
VNKPTRFDPSMHTAGVGRDLAAALVPVQPDPPIPVDGLSIGVSTMSENSPHGGEMHPDGDEVLCLVSGRVNVVFEDEEFEDIEMNPGDGLIVPKGLWHRVDVLEPSQILYATPGPGGEYRPLESNA